MITGYYGIAFTILYAETLKKKCQIIMTMNALADACSGFFIGYNTETLLPLGLFQGDKFREAEEIFGTLLDEKISPLKPDQKMFHMMIYMYKKAGAYDKARKLFALMPERGVQQNTVTYNSLMSFETNYKEVANIYDQVHSKLQKTLLYLIV